MEDHDAVTKVLEDPELVYDIDLEKYYADNQKSTPWPSRIVIRDWVEKDVVRIWNKYISTAKASRLAAELVTLAADLPKDSQPQKWIYDTFTPKRLPATCMAWHNCTYVAKSKTSSMMENCFNRWKMFLKAKLKRAMLIEAIRHIVNQLEVRLVNDADTIQRNVQKGHFIDMRKEPPDTGSDPHKKRRSTWLVFQIENIKVPCKTMQSPEWITAMSFEAHLNDDPKAKPQTINLYCPKCGKKRGEFFKQKIVKQRELGDPPPPKYPSSRRCSACRHEWLEFNDLL
jgi:hypothetical protein